MKAEVLALLSAPYVIKALILAGASYTLDFITGYSKAWKNRNIQSAKLRDGVDKFIKYFAFICIGFLLDFFFSTQYLVIGACVSIALIELKSIDENLQDTGLSLNELITKLSNFSKK